jgi:hypothetical protein
MQARRTQWIMRENSIARGLSPFASRNRNVWIDKNSSLNPNNQFNPIRPLTSSNQTHFQVRRSFAAFSIRRPHALIREGPGFDVGYGTLPHQEASSLYQNGLDQITVGFGFKRIMHLRFLGC